MSNPTSGGVANTGSCALSYISHYVGRFDLTAATNIWDQYKNDFLTTTVIGTGFREYLIDYKCQWTPELWPDFVVARCCRHRYWPECSINNQ